MTLLCSKSNKVKEQRTKHHSGVPASSESRGRQATKREEDKAGAGRRAGNVRRSSSVPLTVTEQHKSDLRQRRLRELENYPFPSGSGSGGGRRGNNTAPATARGSGGFSFLRKWNAKKAAAASDDEDGNAPLPAAATGDDACSLVSSYTVVIDDFTFYDCEENGEEKSSHVTTPCVDANQASDSSPMTLTSVPTSGTNSLGPRGSVSSRSAPAGIATLSSSGVAAASMRRSALSRTPPPTCIPEYQGYYMYDRVDGETKQRVRIRSNRPPRRAKSLESLRPTPILVPGR